MGTDGGYAPAVGDLVLLHPPQGSEREQCGATPHMIVPGGAVCVHPVSRESLKERVLRRIVAGPGDVIAIRDGRVVRNGTIESEPYIRACGSGSMCNFPTAIKIPSDHWFVLGDNRGESVDSRFWGAVPTRWIIGQVMYCLRIGVHCRGD